MSRIVDRIRHQFSTARPVKRAGLILLLLAAFTVGGTSAWAYWTTFGAGTGSATTGTLNAPSAPVANITAPGAVHLTWTGSTLSTGAPAQGYYVTRSSGPAPSTCGTPATPLSAVTCDDTAVADGTYSYTVTAVYHSWTATSGSSNTVTVVNDVTPPTVTSAALAGTSPSKASSVSWTVTFSEVVTGADAADFSLTNVGLGGTPAVTVVTPVSGSTYTVTASTGTGDGTLRLNVLNNGSVFDTASNALSGATFTGATYTIDRTAPTVTLASTPSSPNGANAWFKSTVMWTPSGSDLNGISSCQAALPYSTPDSVAASVTRTCTDTAGNVGTGTSTFKYDGTAPSGSVTSPASAATVLGSSVPVASTNAADSTSGVASVQFQVKPASSGTFADIGPANTTAPYATTWDTTTVANGSYLLQTVVTDAAGNTSTSASTTVSVNNANTFVVSNPGSQIAGVAFGGPTLQLQVNGVNASTFAGAAYTGSKAITFSGPSTSPSGTAPTYPSTVTFTNGLATLPAGAITLTTAQSTTLTATMSADSIAGTSGGFTVVAGGAAKVAFTSTTGSFVGCLFTCNKTALGNNATGTAKISLTDALGNIVSNRSTATTVTVLTTGGALSPTSPSFLLPTTGLAESASFSWTEGFANYTDTVTAKSTGFTDAVAVLKKT